MTRERVRELLERGLTISEIAETLALAKSTVCYHARRLGRPAEGKFAARYDWGAIRRHYEEGFTPRECMERFGFHQSAWFEAVRRGDIVLRSAKEEVEAIVRVQRPVSRGYLKRLLLDARLKSNRCERCGITDWRSRPLPLALHHVNGDSTDNRVENLQILCPNCHSQTPTFSGRNVRRRRLSDVATAA
jgi:HNH endonuclease